MTQSSDWHDRFQADLEAMRQRMEEADRRMEDYFENQARLNADMRTRQEIQQQEIQALQEASRLELHQIQAMRENLLIQSENITNLTQAVSQMFQSFQQHRADGHGA
jgi:hypothetical protein